MRSPNPSSFKNFSGKRRKKIRIFLTLTFLAMTGGVLALVLWERPFPKTIPLPKEQIKSLHLASQPLGLPPQTEDLYREIDQPFTEENSSSLDMEEAELPSPAVNSELGHFFQKQEEKGARYFQENNLWEKNAQKKVRILKGSSQIAVVIEGTEKFTQADWKAVQKLTMPITMIFLASQREAPALAEKAWSKGREIFIKGAVPKGQLLEKRFPHAVGVIQSKTIQEKDSFLLLSPSKGLIDASPHLLFSFPVNPSRRDVQVSQKSILWVRYKAGRLLLLANYLQRLKKKVSFVPLSQFYRESLQPKKLGIVVDFRKVVEARRNLV